MTEYGDKIINPELRPYQRMEKTFFRQAENIPLTQPKQLVGDFAYFDFGIRIPDHDLFKPAEETSVQGGNETKPLPPSIVVQPAGASKPIAYSLYTSRNGLPALMILLTDRYYIEIHVQAEGKLSRTSTLALPFLLMPLDTMSSTIPAGLGGAVGKIAPAIPATWNKYRPNEVLSIGKEEKTSSGGFLKGLLKRKDSTSPALTRA
ncbi:hypothetical protein NliqN6_0008 [Naganishia liquefaciens]|uniref:Uncharacterized protein n=1 Tax=Naganishia liquefaciens TaxID=104408 RepID=A0A8H3YDA6_9TREE|nr:hypothetical protein NliqN6_0008 [Naganishia liquefaciens]